MSEFEQGLANIMGSFMEVNLDCVEKQNQEIEQLQQENKQLKEELELKSGMNIAVQNLKLIEENKQLKERITYLENSNNRREETIISLRHEQQLDKYKEVIKEVREYTEELKPHWLGNDLVLKIIDDLLQILDKVKEDIWN